MRERDESPFEESACALPSDESFSRRVAVFVPRSHCVRERAPSSFLRAVRRLLQESLPSSCFCVDGCSPRAPDVLLKAGESLRDGKSPRLKCKACARARVSSCCGFVHCALKFCELCGLSPRAYSFSVQVLDSFERLLNVHGS